jgi:hypothetical protein
MASKWAKLKANVVQERSPPPKLFVSLQEVAAKHSWSQPPPWITAGSSPTSAEIASPTIGKSKLPGDAASPLYTNVDQAVQDNELHLAEEKSFTDSWQRPSTPPLFDVDIALAAYDNNGPPDNDSFVADTTLASQDANFDGDLSVGSEMNSTGDATYAVDEHSVGEAEYTQAYTLEVKVDHEGDAAATTTAADATASTFEKTPVAIPAQPVSSQLTKAQNTVSFADGSSPGERHTSNYDHASSLRSSNTADRTTTSTADAFQGESSPVLPQRLRGGARSGPFIDTPAVAKQPLGLTPLAPAHRVGAHVPFVKTPFVAKQPLELAFSPATSAAFQTTMAATTTASITTAMTTAAVSTGLYSDTALLDALRTTATFNTPTTKSASTAPLTESMAAEEVANNVTKTNENADEDTKAEMISSSKIEAEELSYSEVGTIEISNRGMEAEIIISGEIETEQTPLKPTAHSTRSTSEAEPEMSSEPFDFERNHANDSNDSALNSTRSTNMEPVSSADFPQPEVDSSVHAPSDQLGASEDPLVTLKTSSAAVPATASNDELPQSDMCALHDEITMTEEPSATQETSSAAVAAAVEAPPAAEAAEAAEAAVEKVSLVAANKNDRPETTVIRTGVQVPAKDRGPPPWLAHTSTATKQPLSSSSLSLSPSLQNSAGSNIPRDQDSVAPNSVGDLYTHAISSSSDDDDETDEEAVGIAEAGEDEDEDSFGKTNASTLTAVAADLDSPRSIGVKSSNGNSSPNASQTQGWLSTAMNRTNVEQKSPSRARTRQLHNHEQPQRHKRHKKSSKSKNRSDESADPHEVGWAAAAPDTDEATRLRYFLSLAEPTTKSSAAAAAAAKKAATRWRATARANSGRASKNQSDLKNKESSGGATTGSIACPLCFLTLEDPQPLDG